MNKTRFNQNGPQYPNKRMTPADFTREAQKLLERWGDYDLDHDDFEIYGSACGCDHWLSMNMMWLNMEYVESRRG